MARPPDRGRRCRGRKRGRGAARPRHVHDPPHAGAAHRDFLGRDLRWPPRTAVEPRAGRLPFAMRRRSTESTTSMSRPTRRRSRSVPARPPGWGRPGPVQSGPVLTAEHVAIDGGVRITGIEVESVSAADDRLTVTVSAPATSPPTRCGSPLRIDDPLRAASTRSSPPSRSRSRQAARTRSTASRSNLPSRADRRARARLPREGLRQLSPADARPDVALAPGWTERNPADSHWRWSSCSPTRAIRSATTRTRSPPRPISARRHRISLRRHARLLDYRMHDGCNARRGSCSRRGTRGRDDAAHRTSRPRVVLLARGAPTPAIQTCLRRRSTRILALARPVVFEPLCASH